MISVEGLSVEFNATPLFEDVSYVINKKDRIALVGKNGAGKSTMLKILAGLQSPTHGIVATPKDVTIGYLPQVMILSDNRTVMGEAELAFEQDGRLVSRLFDAAAQESLGMEVYLDGVVLTPAEQAFCCLYALLQSEEAKWVLEYLHRHRNKKP